jgi:hypothetical protein
MSLPSYFFGEDPPSTKAAVVTWSGRRSDLLLVTLSSPGSPESKKNGIGRTGIKELAEEFAEEFVSRV